MKNIYISTPVRWLIFIVIVIGTIYLVVFPGKNDHGYNYGAMLGSLAILFLTNIWIFQINYSKARKKMDRKQSFMYANKDMWDSWVRILHLKAKRKRKSMDI